MRPRSLLIIRNPHARRAPSEGELWAATEPLREHGWVVRVESTARAGQATELAADAARAGIEVVAACGGDGTVNETLEGLLGTTTALAVIPTGTANVWAREAGVPLNFRRAVSLIPSARAVVVDVGVIEGAFGVRHFLLMCGIGLDAEVVRRVGGESRGKRLLGKAWYAAVATRVLAGAKGVQSDVLVDSAPLTHPLFQLVVGNTRLYGGVMRLTSIARMDDGLLDLCVFSGSGRGRLVRLLARALRGRLHSRVGPGIDYYRGERIDIRADVPLSVQADGEYIGETPVSVSILPRGLTVLMGTRPNVLLGER